MDCDYCLIRKKTVPIVMYHIQNHIEILGYLTHSDPFQIFKIFNQCGHINKGLICKPLFYKIWCVY